MNERDIKIDNLKCFAIYLVILGHSIQAIITNYDQSIIYRLIYTFHMPLFIFLSGFTTYREQEKIDIIYLVKKIKTLLLPFISWAFISSFLIYKLNFFQVFRNLINILIHPDKGLWFLWSLFFINIFYYICKNISKSILPLFFIYLIFLISINYFNLDNKFEIKQTTFLIPFFILGYLIKKYYLYIKPFFKIEILFFLTIIFYILYFKFFSKNNLNFYILFFFKYVSGFIGSIFLFSLFSTINIRLKIFQKIGRITIGIYAIHFYFIDIFFNKLFGFNVSLLFYLPFIILFISYFISIQIKRIKFISTIFLGQ